VIKAVIFDCFGVVLDIMRGTQIAPTVALVKELKGEYALGMLTNAPSRYSLDQRFQPGELDELFDVVVVSGEVGWDKPAPEIFTMAAEKLGVQPEECLFIDDVSAFTEAAAAVGMKTVTFVNVPEIITAIKTMLKENNNGN
jgi:HAD superfamily hydrolase (TIGR01509 family)